METQYFNFQKIGKQQDIMKISLVRQADWAVLSQELVQIFEACLAQNKLKMVIDLKAANHLPSSAVAVLIEITSRLRRAGGDLKLLKVKAPVIASMTAFNSSNFVVRFDAESDVIEEFNELPAAVVAHKAPDKVTPVAAPSQQVFTRPEPPAMDNKQMFRRETPNAEKQQNIVEQQQNSEVWVEDTAPGIPVMTVSPTAVASPENEGASPGDVWNMQHQNTEKYQLRAKSTHHDLYRITEFVENLAEKVGFPREEIGKMKVTVYEACLNIIEHAYHSDPEEFVVVQVEVAGNQFRITIQDWGERFEYDEQTPYDVARAVKERKTGGFGMYIIRRSMDAVRYVSDSVKGNRLMLLKYMPEH